MSIKKLDGQIQAITLAKAITLANDLAMQVPIHWWRLHTYRTHGLSATRSRYFRRKGFKYGWWLYYGVNSLADQPVVVVSTNNRQRNFGEVLLIQPLAVDLDAKITFYEVLDI